MWLGSLSLCVILGSVFCNSDGQATFQNVIVEGYSMFVLKFNQTIESSSSLKDNLPKSVFDAIKIHNQDIPVLHENSISDINNLDELTLTKDNIREISPGTFKNVANLRKVVISGNPLQRIKSGVFNTLNIATLDLSQNTITSIDSEAFDDMPELLNVNLANNQLRKWDKNWFANTPLLTRVSFQNNFIDTIPAGAFQNFEGEKQFGSVSLTINIILSHNTIKDIDKEAFKGLKKISHLWLDNNELDNWNKDLLRGISVKDLYLDGNKFVCFNNEDLEEIFIAESTNIEHNPWDCGCLKNIDLWANRNQKNVIMFYSKLTCDAERIDRKIKALNDRLKELKKNEVEDVTSR